MTLPYLGDLSQVFPPDSNGREIRLFQLLDVQLMGSLYYPDVTCYSPVTGQWYSPIRERIMSMPDVITDRRETRRPTLLEERDPVFFFIFNVDNYYHFVYDTLPYIISYKYAKKAYPRLKLLINSSNAQQPQLSQFVVEFLELLNIKESDVLFANSNTLYNEMIVSSSYTHDGLSNLPPRKEIYDLYRSLANRVESRSHLKKIYVSRRAHVHGKFDNMGTNYTNRRRCTNEDELVDYLVSKGYTEVFTELLSTKDKIAMFRDCTHVVGPIGGGLCNVLFSRPKTQLISIMSPHFMEINGRFCHSFANVQTTYFNDTESFEKSRFKKHMRVRVRDSNITGEIEDIQEDRLKLIYSRDPIAGWNAQIKYENIWVRDDQVDIIDNGLNSAWTVNMDKFRELVNV